MKTMLNHVPDSTLLKSYLSRALKVFWHLQETKNPTLPSLFFH